MVTRPYYLLFEAFERVGEHLYGQQWARNEITAFRQKSPEEVEAYTVAFLAKVASIDVSLEQLAIESRRPLSPERTAEIEREKNLLAAERLATVSKHPDFWSPGWAERLIADARTYQRKVVTEAMIIDAIKAGKFRVESLRQMLDPWVWKDRVVYHNLELSLVLGPRSWGDKSNRFQLVRIPEKEFDAWLEGVEPINPDAVRARQSPEELCGAFLKAEVAAHGDNRPMVRDDYCAMAIAKIPGLTKEAFLRVWNAEAAESWRKPGRRPGKNRRAAKP